MSELTRRQFCVVSGAGLALTACGGSSADTLPQDMAAPSDLATPVADQANAVCTGMVNAGPQSALAVGQAKLITCAKVYVLRDALGIYAMTAICTHMMCTVQFMAARHDFECPCHMSAYDFNGAVTNPPAMLPLQHFACSSDASDNIIVNVDQKVDASTRLSMQD